VTKYRSELALFGSRLMRSYILVVLAALSAAPSFAQSVPPAIFTDLPTDTEHPAGMTVLHIPSHGLQINGIVYQPSGAARHPTLVICHGLPGNEKNLDLAQAVRRAGWNVVTFNYRGSWGSPGAFHFSQNLEDADAVLADLRDPANAERLGIDTHRIVIAGHSMGGSIVVHTAEHDHDLAGAILISAADMAKEGDTPRERLVTAMADNMEALAGVTPESMADELRTMSKSLRFENEAAGLTQTPLLVLTSDDGLTPQAEALVRAIQAQGGHEVKEMHFATDHGWSDHRIALESTIITWLAGLHQGSEPQAGNSSVSQWCGRNGSNLQAETGAHFVPADCGDGQSAGVEFARDPFSFQGDAQQRRTDRATDVRSPLTPIHARICEAAPQRPSGRNVNTKNCKRLRASGCEVVSLVGARASRKPAACLETVMHRHA